VGDLPPPLGGLTKQPWYVPDERAAAHELHAVGRHAAAGVGGQCVSEPQVVENLFPGVYSEESELDLACDGETVIYCLKY
jgi:hypothetical protein